MLIFIRVGSALSFVDNELRQITQTPDDRSGGFAETRKRQFVELQENEPDMQIRRLSGILPPAVGTKMQRVFFSFLWMLTAACGCMRIGALGPAWVVAAEANSLPNIVLIYTDDQGFGDSSYLNSDAKFQTPNLDRLAAEGIAFTNAHCSDTVCTPSRYGLLTGRYCWRTAFKRGVLGAEATCLIEEGRMTIASMLRDAGYQTAMVGKWHLGMDFPGTARNRDWTKPVQDMPLDKGFDYFYGIPASLNYGVLAWFEGRHAKVPPTLFTAKKPNRRHMDYRIMPPYQSSSAQTRRELGKPAIEVASDFVDRQCLTRFTDKAIQWIKQTTSTKHPKPFFVYLPYTSPHYPVCPLPEFHGRGDCGGYGEFMIETDYHIGRLMKHLTQMGLDEETLIIFSSDNGPEKSWRERAKKFGHRSNGIYRGGKREIYEGGHRVPFFVRWPNGITEPGRTCDELIGQTDLLATLAQIVGAEIPSNAAEDSQSFASLLNSVEMNRDRSPVIHHDAKGRFAISDGEWKLVLPHEKKDMELFHLKTDPSESSNVASKHPERLKKLTEAITDIVCNGRSNKGKSVPNDTGYWADLTWITAAEFASNTREE